ncbi:MAG: IS630 family transposase [Sulfobacillus sp.]
MARAYSDDLRRKLLEAHDQGQASLAELALRFGVSPGWVWKISAARKRSGQVERPTYRPGPRSRLNREVLVSLLTDHPDWTLRELQAALKKQTGGRLQCSVFVADIEADEFPAQKKSLHAQERDTEANRIRRREFLDKVRETPPERLIYLDESGVTTQMTRRYARSRDGARIHEAAPQANWKMLTVLGAMSLCGMIATMTIEEPTDADIFLAYVERVLCPKLQPGDVAVMDNLSSHKVDGVQQAIAAVGATVLYLPPYSPDLNPIEKAWSKLKILLRSAQARTKEALDQALSELLPQLTPENAEAWFRTRFGTP